MIHGSTEPPQKKPGQTLEQLSHRLDEIDRGIKKLKDERAIVKAALKKFGIKQPNT